jgi:hypothetical protein
MPLWVQQLLDGTRGKYKVLVVPGCGCLGRAEVAAIEAFVRAGGTAVVCEKAGCYNEFHQTIREWRFAPLFAAAGARSEGFVVRYSDRGYLADFENARRTMFAAFGQGRAVYLPLIRNDARPIRTYEEMGGYDFSLLVPELDWAEPYAFGGSLECYRSFKRRRHVPLLKTSGLAAASRRARPCSGTSSMPPEATRARSSGRATPWST